MMHNSDNSLGYALKIKYIDAHLIFNIFGFKISEIGASSYFLE